MYNWGCGHFILKLITEEKKQKHALKKGLKP